MPDSQDDLLLTLIAPFLIPVFLPTTRDLGRAEQAAIHTLQRIQAASGADLLIIAQFIAFGLASLNTIGLSMGENLDATLVLKLNNSATALARCQERQSRRLEVAPARKPAPQPAARQAPPEPPTPEEEAAIKAESKKQIRIARNLQSVAKKLSDGQADSIDAIELAEAALQMAEMHGKPVVTDVRLSKDPKDLTWAYTYAYTAEECVKDPADYAHGSQKEANYRAKLLNTCSYEALCGFQPDLSGLPDFKFEPLE
jgi:hypothetical protein